MFVHFVFKPLFVSFLSLPPLWGIRNFILRFIIVFKKSERA